MNNENHEGYVYILTNPSFREDWVKIGKCSRPVDVRSKELDNTAVPLPFEIYATLKTAKFDKVEKQIHMINEIKNKIHTFVQKYEQGKEVYRTLRFSMKLRCETSFLILCSRFLVTTLISRQLSVNISTPIMKMPQRNSWSILVRTLYIQVTSMRYRVGLKQTSITNWLKNSFCSRSTIGV